LEKHANEFAKCAILVWLSRGIDHRSARGGGRFGLLVQKPFRVTPV
jgi:hypothetical protein